MEGPDECASTRGKVPKQSGGWRSQLDILKAEAARSAPAETGGNHKRTLFVLAGVSEVSEELAAEAGHPKSGGRSRLQGHAI